ncbi:MAG: hypothetical protein JWO94_1586 [Verrucomicrobiaceae bacterium]|nr:hypothetical protein [Verrucomicrobiaceae bacterium]
MKMHVLLTLLLLLACLPACKHAEKPKDVAYDGKMQSTLPIPSYTREALDGWPEGRKLNPYDSTRVRFADNIHTYQVGRLPSMDRREMQEAHTVYRVEQSAHWDQRLPATPMESRGVVLGIREPSTHPVPPDQVVANERSRQLQLSGEIQGRLDDLTVQQRKLDAFLASAPDKSKTIDQLQAQKIKADADVGALRAETDQLKRELQEYKDREAIQAATIRSSKKSAEKK